MIEVVYSWLNFFLGFDQENLNFFHMSMRGLVVYIFGTAVIYINKRFIAIHTKFDFILYVMLGSILAGAIMGDAPFLPVLGMTLLLVTLNWLLVKLTAYSSWFDALIKGTPILLVDNGTMHPRHMKKNSITSEEIMSFLRIQTGTTDLANVEKAYLEPSGSISFILKKKP